MIRLLCVFRSRLFPLYIVFALAYLLAGAPAQANSASAYQDREATVTATSTPDLCRDSFEDDGVRSQARPIAPGETQTHYFCPAGDADWLTFFVSRGSAYSIETADLSAGANTYLNLFAPDGETLLYTSEGAIGASRQARIAFYPDADGRYYVQVKNQNDIGYAGLLYSISLNLADVPTSTPAPSPSATLTGTLALTSTLQAGTGSDLFHPQKGDGGVDVFIAGPADAMSPDALEANDSRETARAVNVGAVYKYLNFVAGAGAVDDDFYTFRAKPGLCYLVETGDLSSGLDTTILLWQAANTREKWKLLAQNDDAHPRTADLSSEVHWCASDDESFVAEVRNYGGEVVTDPRGKSYSLSVLVDPPTPTPTHVPPKAQSLSPQPQNFQPSGVVQAQQVPPAPTHTATVVEPALTRVPDAPTATQTSATATATPTSLEASVDVVAYIADRQATGPNPGDGIVDLPALLVDVRTNAVIRRANTDANGHARLTWQWQGPVRVALPSFRWGRTLQLTDFSRGDDLGDGRTLLLQARMSGYVLPGIYP